MTKRTCHWDGCKTKIQLDTSLENHSRWFVVSGWCDVHHQAFKIETYMEQEFCKKMKIDWPIGSLSYKKYKKQLNKIHKDAGKRAEAAVIE